MSAAQEIMLVRHPETVANLEKRLIGSGHSPYTALGRAQCAALAREIVSWDPAVIYTSPLERTRLVAEAADPDCTRTVALDGLREIGFGQAEGLTWDEMRERNLELDYTSGGPIAPGGESGSAFDARVRDAAQTLTGTPGRVTAISHGGVVRRLLAHWLEIPSASAWHLGIANAVIVRVRFEGGYARLTELRQV